MENEKNRVPEYMKRAIKKYNEKIFRVAVLLPMETREKLTAAAGDRTVGSLCRDIIMEWLKNHDTSGVDQTGTPQDTRSSGESGSGSGSDDSTIDNSDIYFE